MQSNAIIKDTNGNTNSNLYVQGLLEDRIEALRALATLMLRGVESLEKAVPLTDNSNVEFEENNFCLQSEIQRYEASLIRSALVKAQGSQQQPRLLDVKVTTLNAKIKNTILIGVSSDSKANLSLRLLII